MTPVDVLTVIAPGQTVLTPVTEALNRQGNVRVNHFIVESPAPSPCEQRASTIARGRNRARRFGSAGFAMFLDSDVALPPRGIEHLLFGLMLNRRFAALGINYQHPESAMPQPVVHVAMGSMLIYRSILDRIEFRTEPGRCECSCCCLDIRRMGYEVSYLSNLRADHLKRA